LVGTSMEVGRSQASSTEAEGALKGATKGKAGDGWHQWDAQGQGKHPEDGEERWQNRGTRRPPEGGLVPPLLHLQRRHLHRPAEDGLARRGPVGPDHATLHIPRSHGRGGRPHGATRPLTAGVAEKEELGVGGGVHEIVVAVVVDVVDHHAGPRAAVPMPPMKHTGKGGCNPHPVAVCDSGIGRGTPTMQRMGAARSIAVGNRRLGALVGVGGDAGVGVGPALGVHPGLAVEHLEVVRERRHHHLLPPVPEQVRDGPPRPPCPRGGGCLV